MDMKSTQVHQLQKCIKASSMWIATAKRDCNKHVCSIESGMKRTQWRDQNAHRPPVKQLIHKMKWIKSVKMNAHCKLQFNADCIMIQTTTSNYATKINNVKSTRQQWWKCASATQLQTTGQRIKVMQYAALTSNAKDHSYYTTQTTLSTICTEA